MVEIRRDVSLSVVIRIGGTGNWLEWSTGHRAVPEVLAVAEVIVSHPAIAEIRFDRVTRTTERLSLHDLAVEAESPPERPVTAVPAPNPARDPGDAPDGRQRPPEGRRDAGTTPEADGGPVGPSQGQGGTR